jgi:hypothetical protein
MSASEREEHTPSSTDSEDMTQFMTEILDQYQEKRTGTNFNNFTKELEYM